LNITDLAQNRDLFSDVHLKIQTLDRL